jgi:hypothetical protein
MLNRGYYCKIHTWSIVFLLLGFFPPLPKYERISDYKWKELLHITYNNYDSYCNEKDENII